MVIPRSGPSRATFGSHRELVSLGMSERAVRALIAIACAVLLSSQAMAASEDYCAAYARDFADVGRRDEAVWQHRYDNAKEACLLQFTPAQAEAPPPPKPKPKPKPKVAVVEPADEEVIVAPDVPPKETQTKSALQKLAKKVTGGGGKLKPGSEAWLDYCDRKYASFNRETGTYKSWSGVERKCFVPANN